jgi:hypothetical protein
MTRDEAVAAHLIPQRPPPMLSEFGPNPETQRDAVALFKHPSLPRLDQSPTEAIGPGAATAKSATKCHLWLGLACDRLNGLL